MLARRYGVSTETIRKWRKRGADDCLDHSARPHQLPWKATDEERAVSNSHQPSDTTLTKPLYRSRQSSAPRLRHLRMVSVLTP